MTAIALFILIAFAMFGWVCYQLGYSAGQIDEFKQQLSGKDHYGNQS